jgi:hypothetical protein
VLQEIRPVATEKSPAGQYCSDKPNLTHPSLPEKGGAFSPLSALGFVPLRYHLNDDASSFILQAFFSKDAIASSSTFVT